MPRDGSHIYYLPPGTPGIPDTTIESTKYNVFIDDVEYDLNAPRPIIAGGTGANNARDAMINLHGEISGQVVDNYDSFPFVAGSFYSSPGATSAPVAGHWFMGICTMVDSGLIILDGRDPSDPVSTNWVRRKVSGAWEPWFRGDAAMDAAKVNRSGDTMTGPLTVNALITSTGGVSTNGAVLSQGDVTANGSVIATTGEIRAGDGVFRVGATANYLQFDGSQWNLAGGPLNIPANMLKFGTSVSFLSDGADAIIHTSGSFNVQNAATTNLFWVDNGGTTHALGNMYADAGILYLGANATIDTSSGVTKVNRPTGSIGLQIGPTDSYYLNDTHHFSNAANAVSYAVLNSTGLTVSGNLTVSGTYTFNNLSVTGTLTVGNNLSVTGKITSTDVTYSAGRVCRPGLAGPNGTDFFNINWITGTGPATLWVNTSNIGQFAFTSDYRTKKDVVELPDMWETVKALRPISYTQAAYGDLFAEDDIERWGFIAHELQETLTLSAATGTKDEPNVIQSPNPFTLIAALTKALQEAMTRIEALEGAARPGR